MNKLLIFCIIWSIPIVLVEGDDVVACGGWTDTTTTIDCGPDSVIQVHQVRVAFIRYRGDCSVTVIVNKVDNTPSRCKTTKHSRFGCHGSQSCPIPHDKGATRLGWNCESRAWTNAIHINYSCVKKNETYSAVLPLYEDVTARNLHVFSPEYPTRMPNFSFSFSCVITAARADSGTPTNMELRVERLHFHKTTRCTERLYFVKDGANSTTFCSNSNNKNNRDIWRRKLPLFTVQTLKFVYVKAVDVKPSAGLFWLNVKGSQNDAPVDLRITCPDQLQIPGYTTTPKPTTTMTTTTTSLMTPANLRTSDEEENGTLSTVLLAVLLSVIGLILITAIVAVFLLLKIRTRNKTNANKETIEDTDAEVVDDTYENTKVGVSNYYSSNTDLKNENRKTKEVKKPKSDTKERRKKPRHEVYENVEKNKENTNAACVVVGEDKQKPQTYENVEISKSADKKDTENEMDQSDDDKTKPRENNDQNKPKLKANEKDSKTTNNENNGKTEDKRNDTSQEQDVKLNEGEGTAIYENI